MGSFVGGVDGFIVNLIPPTPLFQRQGC